jgi:hypothetical protein
MVCTPQTMNIHMKAQLILRFENGTEHVVGELDAELPATVKYVQADDCD